MGPAAMVVGERSPVRRGLPAALAVAVATALLMPAAAPAAEDGGASAPAAVRQQARDDGLARVLVELDVPTRPEGALSPQRAQQQRSGIDRAQEAVLGAIEPGERRVTARLERLPVMGLRVSQLGLEALERAPHVARISPDRVHRPLRGETVPHVWGDAGAPDDGPDGAGHTVAVLDTGVATGHPAFDGTDIEEACFASGSGGLPTSGGDCPNGGAEEIGPGAAEPLDDHGTHVAGIAVGAGTGLTFEGRSDGPGVAPAADLLAVQVFSDGGGAFQSDILRGLEHVAQRADDGEPIAAVNLSLGSEPTHETACPDAAYEAAAAELASHGVATVAAAGNGGSQEGVSRPACVDGIASVGATAIPDEHPGPEGDPPEAEQIASYSNAGDLVDLVAPGNVVAPVPGGELDRISGTSMAAPHVAGAWAVLQEATAEWVTPASALGVLTADGVPASVPDDRGSSLLQIPQYDGLRLAAAIGSLDDPVSAISGTVTDDASGDTIDDATVTAVGRQTLSLLALTGSDGGYTLELAPDTYTVTADADGYQPATRTGVGVAESETVGADFTLQPATRLSVTVTDAGGEPIDGASVAVDAAGAELAGTTDGQGHVRWSTDEGDDVPTGAATATASASGHQSASTDTTIHPGERNEVTLTLEAASSGLGLLQPILDLLSLDGLGLGL